MRKFNSHSIPIRLNLLFSFVILLFMTIIGRLLYMQVLNKDFYEKKLASASQTKVTTSSARGEIYDASGKPLVENTLKQVVSFTRSNKMTAKGDNLSFDVKKGEIIGLSGPSGCGKSTIAKLIMKFISDENMEGNITIDGIDLRDIDNRYFRENSSIILQDSYLFNAKIKDNITFFEKDLDKEELDASLRKTNLRGFVDNLKRRENEIVGERSSNISSGQKQRLSVARSFYNDSKLLILDEATANIDIFSEIEVLKALEESKKDKITIIISHNKSTLSICDKVIRLGE